MTLSVYVKHRFKVMLLCVIKLCKVKGKGQAVTCLCKHTGEVEIQLSECLYLFYIRELIHTWRCAGGNYVSPLATRPTSLAVLTVRLITLLIPTWCTIFHINYIQLSSSTCFERHSLILRRSVVLIVHVCSLWYSHSVKVNYCFIVLGICYNFVKRKQHSAIQPHIVFSFLTKW